MSIKKISRATLFTATLLSIVGFGIIYLGDIPGLEFFNAIDIEWMSLLPGVLLMLVLLLVGSFGGSLPLVIIGWALPVILLVSISLAKRSKILYRITVYPILLASVIVNVAFAPLEWLLIIPQIVYFVLAIIADPAE